MKVAITSDHAGFILKEAIIPVLETDGHEIIDLGPSSNKPVDYPDFALRLALFIVNKSAERGIFICGSGVGGNVVLNKIRGIRAGICHDSYSAHQGVEHDDMNIICLGSRVVGIDLAIELCQSFLNAEFSGEERHKRRLAKLVRIENRYAKPVIKK
jgi:RpiB/LacA/LacB family sugar-phosphate isomerase